MATDFTIMGGDAQQQERRRRQQLETERPQYWLGMAERAFLFGMRGHGNQPDIELSNCVGFLVRAVEYGADPSGGFLSEQLANRIDAEPAHLAKIWRSVAVALELMAQQRIVAHNSAAQDEAIASMEQVPA